MARRLANRDNRSYQSDERKKSRQVFPAVYVSPLKLLDADKWPEHGGGHFAAKRIPEISMRVDIYVLSELIQAVYRQVNIGCDVRIDVAVREEAAASVDRVAVERHVHPSGAVVVLPRCIGPAV